MDEDTLYDLSLKIEPRLPAWELSGPMGACQKCISPAWALATHIEYNETRGDGGDNWLAIFYKRGKKERRKRKKDAWQRSAEWVERGMRNTLPEGGLLMNVWAHHSSPGGGIMSVSCSSSAPRERTFYCSEVLQTESILLFRGSPQDVWFGEM